MEIVNRSRCCDLPAQNKSFYAENRAIRQVSKQFSTLVVERFRGINPLKSIAFQARRIRRTEGAVLPLCRFSVKILFRNARMRRTELVRLE